MTGIGTPFDDADPEDGWDASDAVVFQLDNLVVRIHDLLEASRPDRAGRITRLFIHLAFIRDRIENGDL